MRAAAFAITLALAFAAAGCLGQGTVRAVLLEETVMLDEGAPESAHERLRHAEGCAPGIYDPERREIHLLDRDTTPRFAVIVPWGDGNAVLSAGGGGRFAVDLGVLSERGTSGSWGFSSPFPGVAPGPAVPFHPALEWDREGVRFDGEPLVVGETLQRESSYEAAWDNATFTVTHSFDVTYLGRVAYEMDHVC